MSDDDGRAPDEPSPGQAAIRAAMTGEPAPDARRSSRSDGAGGDGSGGGGGSGGADGSSRGGGVEPHHVVALPAAPAPRAAWNLFARRARGGTPTAGAAMPGSPGSPGATRGLRIDAEMLLRPVKTIVAALVPEEPPLELQIVGRTLLHAALVGLMAGIVGSAFLWALLGAEHLLLEQLAHYVPLRAAGDVQPKVPETAHLRWYVLLALPALGGLACGWITRFAPEVRGGGADAAINAFHHGGGRVRRRVLGIKPLASIATLSTGGAGGREGPTMQLGAAIGATVAYYLRLGARERRVLMVAGVGAGISAVFRTPLGAALLAIEFLYRDDFESEALIPAVLSSVIAYSVAIGVFGTQPLFGKLPHYPFLTRHLPVYLGLAIAVSAAATLFGGTMAAAKRAFAAMPGPTWLKPAIGGLALGVLVTIALMTLGPWLGNESRGLGLLGGGYGAGQLAISGASWLEPGWQTVELLCVLALAKIIAASLTIGSGGSAGDFAPSIAIGGLVGGAFGGAARILLDDPTIDPGAFALVGMAAFYAGIANVPLAALVIVCEVAGSYDLLVPLMLTEGVAMIALRKVNLYHAQPRTHADSPVHASALTRLTCGDAIDRTAPTATLALRQSAADAHAAIDASPAQDVFPVLGDAATVVGLVTPEHLRALGAGTTDIVIVADLMVPPLVLQETDTLQAAALALVKRELRAAPVVDRAGAVVGVLDQQDIVAALTSEAPRTTGTMAVPTLPK